MKYATTKKARTKLSLSHIEVLEYPVAINQVKPTPLDVSINFTSFATLLKFSRFRYAKM